ncbi:Predicted anti-sigma-YlaC factor YlaD, contains Zn-finger domain [Micromonospora viridifaciens]|uniref:Predicted anti-sigma-YlaC factor YlaD, contains Zn-finger domain n=1 Tax=Micromonospora viridifaciens TaxID=1881 RepID=A0A1C4YW52_MICVI|nr:zf-HC2 domain-containing protein [Micromonospora viridifaciens]SCF24975.1 Predicted anti-sigma-YlaC factor YlaD, contains Zn-finger domain [Micromonospora viridifaciens]
MGCEQWREVLSAQLDGEATTTEQAGTDAHLDECADCRMWLDQAAAITRRSRLTLTTPGPDLADTILAALPTLAPSHHRRIQVVLTLRGLLGLLGALQLVLGLAQIGRGPAGGHDHTGVLAAGHLWHESAAWNVAVGAGFLFVAARRTRPAGLVPMLSTFVGALVLLSVNDLLTGRVDIARLVSHGFLLAGYAIVVALSRPRLRPDGPPARGRSDRLGWRLNVDEAAEPVPAQLRLVPPYPSSAQVGGRRAA